jgi:hypothetical protein
MLEKDGLTGRAQTRLLDVLRMEAVAAENAVLAGFRHRVDHKGAVTFTLPGGGMIRGEGWELFFSAKDAAARQATVAYVRKKWGWGVMMEENRIVREPEQRLAATIPEQEKDRGFDRQTRERRALLPAFRALSADNPDMAFPFTRSVKFAEIYTLPCAEQRRFIFHNKRHA